jgi:hypothetical protein
VAGTAYISFVVAPKQIIPEQSFMFSKYLQGEPSSCLRISFSLHIQVNINGKGKAAGHGSRAV